MRKGPDRIPVRHREVQHCAKEEFLQFKTFGKHKVSDDRVVVCAGNPIKCNRNVHEFDIMTLDRMREIDAEPSYDARKAYAQNAVQPGAEPRQPGPDAALAEHYRGKRFEYGFASVCKMVLPASDLKGKTVLDVCCRRGRGVYKISAMVGDGGSVWGIDWNEAYILEAKDGMGRAWRDSGLARSNMEFRVAFPEDLVSAGIGSSTMDAVYVNNVITLFYDQPRALREFSRVLRPGGLLILETVFADRPRRDDIVDAARAMGNSIQAARTKEENYAWLAEAGFEEPSIEASYEVDAGRGYKEGSVVAVVEGDERVAYEAVSLYVRKRK